MSSFKLSTLRFSDLNLADELQKAIADAGFNQCTPIQAACLPLGLAGKDVAGQAQTGTGKTAAFLITVLQHCIQQERQHTGIRAFILAPTRELAIQIHRDALILSKYCQLNFALIYGGLGYQSQKQSLKPNIDILIGTPGRLIDYYKQKLFSLRNVEIVVLDEADRMFDLGFIKDVRFLFRRMPKPDQRLNLLFSATLNYRVTELAYELMNDPEWINLSNNATPENITETIYYTGNDQKIPLLLSLLADMQDMRCLIFINTKHHAETVSSYLLGNGWQAAVLSGDVPQIKRQKLLDKFINGKLPILVATDIAARGLHIPNVKHVINFDLPQDPEDYIHRIGRTARAGASGEAISFACENYAFHLADIEAFIGHKLSVAPLNEEMLVTPLPAKRIDRSNNQDPRRKKQVQRRHGHSKPSRNPNNKGK